MQNFICNQSRGTVKLRRWVTFLLTFYACLGWAPLSWSSIQTLSTSLEQSIRGKVVIDASGEALPGVTVMLYEASGSGRQGTTTDEKGEFSFTGLKDGTAYNLEFSFIGFEKQSVEAYIPTAENRGYLEIRLRELASSLAEVVVVGYGNTQKKDITGSIKSLKSGEFNAGIINSPEQLLQGKVAGVNVTSATGEPGGAQSITIRGPGTVRNGSTPLFVIDGMALDNSGTGGAMNPLNFLNPDDIESMDVLKDASATAIYGARGANGVILITTKRGKEGFSGINYSGSVGISKIARKLPLLSAEEFRKEVRALGGTDLIDEGGNTDWQDEITRTAITHNHNLNLNGGTKGFSYFGSLGVQKQEGILRGNSLDRYSGRINLNQKLLNDRVSIDVNLNASNTKNNRPPIGGMLGGALSANPTYPAYNASGKPFHYPDGTNPLIPLALEKDITETNRIIASITPSVTLVEGLVYKLNFGLDHSTSVRDLQSLANEEPFQEGRFQTIDRKNSNQLIENYLTYTLEKPRYSLTALLGHSYQKLYVQERSFSINRLPLTEVEPIYNPGIGQDLTLAQNRPYGFAHENELQSFFSRVNYQLADKYLATATLRIDGSSKFGANNKYGVFPSFSVGWRLSEEDFMKSTPFSDLKLRAGWGQTGNQEIPPKITHALFTSTISNSTSYPLDNSNIYSPGTTYTRLANPNIQWEVSTQTDIGLDFALFQGAISGTIDYFNKISKHILLEVIPADPVQPAGSLWTNVADMEIRNQGVEFDLHYRKRLSSGLTYGLGVNATFIKNEVSNSPYSVIPSGSVSGSGLTSSTINGYINGQPIGTFFLREFIGFDENGIGVYRDINQDGISNDLDRIPAGTALPTRMFNINGDVAFKGFDLALNFNGVAGNKVYDNTANAHFYKLRLSKGINTTREALEYPEESVNNAAPVSTRFLKDGAFFRLNNAVLGYSFDPVKLGISKYVSSLRLSVTGQNLFVITKYTGYDPEVNNDRAINGVSSYGIDYLSYPKARSFIFGIHVGFAR